MLKYRYNQKVAIARNVQRYELPVSERSNNAMRRPLILAILDPGLRSILAAYLTMAGETPISTADHLDPTLDAMLRDRAILVIEEPLIASAPRDWAETLRDQCWTGCLIIIAHTLEPVEESDGIALVNRRDAPAAIPPIIRRWRGQPAV